MKVADLRLGLELHLEMLSRWGGKSSEIADLRRFIELLAENDELTVASLCQKFSDKQSKAATTAARPRAPSTIIDDAIVAEYISKFGDPNANRAGFHDVVAHLKANAKAKLPEVNRVIELIIASGVTYKKKNDAIAALTTWGNRKFDTERRTEGTSGIF